MCNAFLVAENERGSLVVNQSTLSAVTLTADNSTELLAPTRRAEDDGGTETEKAQVQQTRRKTQTQKKERNRSRLKDANTACELSDRYLPSAALSPCSLTLRD